jgi:hypothetical protein
MPRNILNQTPTLSPRCRIGASSDTQSARLVKALSARLVQNQVIVTIYYKRALGICLGFAGGPKMPAHANVIFRFKNNDIARPSEETRP